MATECVRAGLVAQGLTISPVRCSRCAAGARRPGMTCGSIRSPGADPAGKPADPKAILKLLAVPMAYPRPAACSYRAQWPPCPALRRARLERQRAGCRDHVHLVQRVAGKVAAAIRVAGQHPPSSDGGGEAAGRGSELPGTADDFVGLVDR